MHKSRNSTASALVMGLCSHGLSVARALAARGINVVAIEKDRTLPGVSSNSVSDIIWINSFSDLDLLEGLNIARKRLTGQIVLMPVNDNHVRFIGINWNQLKDHFLLSWSSCIHNTLRLQKKSELEGICREREISYPKSKVIESTKGIEELTLGFIYPLILKPVKPLSSFKTKVCKTPEELKSSIQRYQSDLPILCQEYISGSDEDIYFVELFYDNGNPLFSLVGRKILSYPKAQGQALIAEILEDQNKKLMDLAYRFFDGLGLSGPQALEVKRDQNGEFWVIEPTVGRTEFFVEMVISSGINIPYLAFLLATGQKEFPRCCAKPVIWFDTEKSPFAFISTLFSRPECFSISKKVVFPFLDSRDVKPFIRAVSRLSSSAIGRLIGPNN